MTHEENRDAVRIANELRAKNGLEPLPKIAISFSGGRTSAVMTKKLWDAYQGSRDIIITFANTGCEHEATLEFVHRCETEFGWPVVWLEAVVNPEKGKGIRHKIVNFDTASRNGEPFRAAIEKYGIFNKVSPNCTERLKVEVMNSFLTGCNFLRGKKLNYKTAIGIRADEADRVSLPAVKQYGAIYPLVDMNFSKRDVGLEIATWGFDLQIPGDHFGNCVWCWKKSLRKLMTVARQDSTAFDFPAEMEAKHGKDYINRNRNGGRDNAHFFREHMSAVELQEMAATRRFREYTDDAYEHGWERELDLGGSCGDSCEIGADWEY